ncbi:GDSL lipase/esterase [Epithele typhae]|uniref:GDSL lipase/esterase n=1 Tax=Epithele typhae TaxID=378194 RepID=UPI0020074375|nr:GDSL lipase/esterase [Epithele typhae]KAH9931699.1 GDSL lipase/esterase [Epithele typhae]
MFWKASIVLVAASAATAKLTWGETKFLFTFGDSYTTDGFNISAGVNSPTPGFTSSNGPNWVEFLGGTYNVTNTKVFNLAYGGATIDAALVAPYLPTVLSIVDQVGQFHDILASKPEGAEWQSSDSLFAFWIGINDVGNSYSWTNVTQSSFHATLMNRLFGQVEELYQDGARSFLFLTVPPTNRAPLLIEQGRSAVQTIASSLADYNAQLQAGVKAFQKKHHDLDQVTVFDTRPIFNTLLDNAKTLGFVNSTGFCDAYQNGTPNQTTQTAPCAPVSSYFWLNSLHPLFTVHNILAHAISTVLSA